MTGDAVIAGQLREQVLALYRDLAAGNDVPPARRFRLEGALALAEQVGMLQRDELLAWLHESGVEATGIGEANAGLALPLQMAPAPVFPSTRGEDSDRSDD